MLRDVFDGGEDGAEELACEKTVKAGFFCERDELVWRDETALWMLPAGESFEAAEESGAKFDERLKIGNDLVILECSAQIVRVAGSHG